MRTFAYIATVGVLAAVLLSGCSDKEAPSDIDRLQGTWQMVSAERRGRPSPSFAKMMVVIEGDMLTLMLADEVKYKGTITLDPSGKPKTLNMELVPDKGGQEKARVSQGIYMVEGDTFKWCNAAPGVDDRPTEFSTNNQKNHLLLVLKRQKK